MECKCVWCGKMFKPLMVNWSAWCSVGCEVWDRTTGDDWLRWLFINEARTKLIKGQHQ